MMMQVSRLLMRYPGWYAIQPRTPEIRGLLDTLGILCTSECCAVRDLGSARFGRGCTGGGAVSPPTEVLSKPVVASLLRLLWLGTDELLAVRGPEHGPGWGCVGVAGLCTTADKASYLLLSRSYSFCNARISIRVTRSATAKT